MARYRHIVWDWNGTLLDDTWLCHELGNLQLKRYDLPELSLDEFREQFTTPVKEFYEKIGFDFSRVPFEVLSKDFHDEYKLRRHECRLHSDSVEILAEFSSHQVTHSILSAHSQVMLEEIIELLSISHHFTHIVGLRGIPGQSKIDEGKRWLLEAQHEPHEILVVGDTLHDYEVAKDLGADCVLIPRGFQSRAVIERAGVKVVQTLAELRAHVLIKK